MPHQRDWIDYLVAFAPFMAICVAVSVALMQAHLQRLNLQLALYDRRFTIRQHVLQYYGTTYTQDRPIEPEVFAAIRLTAQHAQNLFGSDVTDFLKQCDDNMIKADQKRQECNTANMTGNLTEELKKQYTEAMAASFRDRLQITAVFKPYLNLHQDESWLARFVTRLNRWVNQDVPAELKSGRYPS